MFFKKSIILNCYTSRSDVFNYFPIQETKKTFPKWLKTLKKSYFNSVEDCLYTVKNCPAFVDYFLTGFTLPLWSDLALTVGKNGTDAYRWQYSDCRSQIDFHSLDQMGLDIKDYQHFKLLSPWVFSCSEDINFLWSRPSWRFGDMPETVQILDGVVNYKINAATHINMLVKKTEKNQNILLSAETPMAHIIPLTERKIVLKTHLVTEEVMNSIMSVGSRISFPPQNKKKIQKALKGKFRTL